MTTLSRRCFLASAAACAVTPALPLGAGATAAARRLTAASRTIEVKGRAAQVFGLMNQAGGQGLILDPGERFRVDLTNALAEDAIVHWHGQIPPNAQDGVPDMPLPALKPGEVRSYDFAPLPGTHWMHSHRPLQEMRLLAAPLIVRGAAEAAEDRQEVVMFLHDFSFAEPAELLAGLANAGGHDMAGMGDGGHDMAGMGNMDGMAMDLNDIDFDAYLANDRTLADPDVIAVEPGGRVRLRIINGAAATSFWVDLGAVEGSLVAVDGHAVKPLKGRRFGLAMAQRLDILVDLPPGDGAWPILALREGTVERTGIILATPGAKVAKIAATGDSATPAFDIDLAQESALSAAEALPDRPAARTETLMLEGTMSPYLWTINGATWGDHVPVAATSGERVEITFHNMSMMGHPMHLHGHSFQVVGINGRRLAGAVRDTVYVPPAARLTIAFDAGEAASWMLHCHHMPHLASGMMTELRVA
jgi:FtsP/CotA-like multicopper oxidase with cupredoxin domain